MENLSITTTGISVTKPEKEITHVLQNHPAFLDEYSKVKDIVLAQVIKSITHLNWKLPNDDDMDILINEITTSIQNNYKQLRKEEIDYCFAKGIRGEYGEFMGMSVVTFEKFIIGYLASPYRAQLGKTIPKAEIAAPSKEITRQGRIDFALAAFSKFKESGYYNDLGNIVYDFLDSEKLIPFSTPEKYEMLEEARQEEYRRLQNPLSMAEAKKFNKQIEELMESNSKIIPKSKRIALNRYFKRLQSCNQELTFY